MSGRMALAESNHRKLPCLPLQQPLRCRTFVFHTAQQPCLHILNVGHPRPQSLGLKTQRITAKLRFHFLEKSRRLRTRLTIPGPGAPIEDSLAAKTGLGESFRNIVYHTPASLLVG